MTIAQASGASLSAADVSWRGLTRLEILDLVLEIAPPFHRADRLWGAVPSESASKLTSYLIKEVIEAKILRQQPHRRSTRTISQQLMTVLGMSDASVSPLRSGKFFAKDNDAAAWVSLQNAFSWLLLGADAAEDDERRPLVDRLTQYFFARKGEEPPAFFARGALGNASPQRANEGVYTALWIANQTLHHKLRSCIVLVSGQLPFFPHDLATLRETDQALIYAAAAGTRVIFAFPESKSQATAAEASARRFLVAAQRYVESAQTLPEADCLFHREPADFPQQIKRRAMMNVRLCPVNVSNPAVMPGFFVPGIRFSALRTYQRETVDRRLFYLIRAHDVVPPMFQLAEPEEMRFFEWCKQINLPVDATTATTGMGIPALNDVEPAAHARRPAKRRKLR